MISGSPRSPERTGEMSTEAVIGDYCLKIAHAPRAVPGPCSHDGSLRSLMTPKARKPWGVRMKETTFLALCWASAQNSEWRSEAALRLPLWGTKGRVNCPALVSRKLWVLFASPTHPHSQRISARALPHYVGAHHSLSPVLRAYLERSSLSALLPTI